MEAIKHFLQDSPLPKVSLAEAQVAKTPITHTEVEEFIKKQNANKAPGITGIMARYFKLL